MLADDLISSAANNDVRTMTAEIPIPLIGSTNNNQDNYENINNDVINQSEKYDESASLSPKQTTSAHLETEVKKTYLSSNIDTLEMEKSVITVEPEISDIIEIPIMTLSDNSRSVTPDELTSMVKSNFPISRKSTQRRPSFLYPPSVMNENWGSFKILTSNNNRKLEKNKSFENEAIPEEASAELIENFRRKNSVIKVINESESTRFPMVQRTFRRRESFPCLSADVENTMKKKLQKFNINFPISYMSFYRRPSFLYPPCAHRPKEFEGIKTRLSALKKYDINLCLKPIKEKNKRKVIKQFPFIKLQETLDKFPFRSDIVQINREEDIYSDREEEVASEEYEEEDIYSEREEFLKEYEEADIYSEDEEYPREYKEDKLYSVREESPELFEENLNSTDYDSITQDLFLNATEESKDNSRSRTPDIDKISMSPKASPNFPISRKSTQRRPSFLYPPSAMNENWGAFKILTKSTNNKKLEKAPSFGDEIIPEDEEAEIIASWLRKKSIVQANINESDTTKFPMLQKIFQRRESFPYATKMEQITTKKLESFKTNFPVSYMSFYRRPSFLYPPCAHRPKEFEGIKKRLSALKMYEVPSDMRRTKRRYFSNEIKNFPIKEVHQSTSTFPCRMLSIYKDEAIKEGDIEGVIKEVAIEEEESLEIEEMQEVQVVETFSHDNVYNTISTFAAREVSPFVNEVVPISTKQNTSTASFSGQERAENQVHDTENKILNNTADKYIRNSGYIQNNEKQQQQQNEIYDAKLAETTNIIAINTTNTSNTQNTDEDDYNAEESKDLYEICIGESAKIQKSAHILYNSNNKNYKHEPFITPPTECENFELLETTITGHSPNTIATLLNTIQVGADNDLQSLKTPATCSDVRGPSSQEVPLTIEQEQEGVSSATCVRRARRLSENEKVEHDEYVLEVLPKICTSTEKCDDISNWAEVDAKLNKDTDDVNGREFNNIIKEQSNENRIAEVKISKCVVNGKTGSSSAMTVTEIEDSEELCEELCEEIGALNVIAAAEDLVDEMKLEMKSAKRSLPETEILRRVPTTSTTLKSNEQHQKSMPYLQRQRTGSLYSDIGNGIGAVAGSAAVGTRISGVATGSAGIGTGITGIDTGIGKRISSIRVPIGGVATGSAGIDNAIGKRIGGFGIPIGGSGVNNTIGGYGTHSGGSLGNAIGGIGAKCTVAAGNVLGSALSKDIPKYGSSTVLPHASSNVSRTVSVDGLDTLPARTRLRRQRQMRSQDSEEQPEDPIERLNRLRARISGALSEVKGVLKQYSTETDATEETTVDQSEKSKTLPESETTSQSDGPVRFRFVKVIRRRSIFNEEDEDKAQQEKTEENNRKVKDNQEEIVLNTEKPLLIVTEVSQNTKETENTVQKSNVEVVEEKDVTKTEKLTEEPKEIEKEQESTNNIVTSKIDAAITSGDTTSVKTKKKSTNKANDTSTKQHNIRRASIAAVEGSKIEPPIATITPLNLKAQQRRPSDSEAIIKKRTLAKSTINDVASEMVPKVKAIKVKRTSVKSRTNAVDTKATATLAVRVEATTTASAAISASIKSDDANFSDRDAAMLASDTTTTETTTIKTTPTVIDVAASTTNDSKTIDELTNAATKLEQVADAMVATLSTSPLRASEANSSVETTTQQSLAELVGATIIVRPTVITADSSEKLEEQQETAIKSGESGNDKSLKTNHITEQELPASVLQQVFVDAEVLAHDEKSFNECESAKDEHTTSQLTSHVVSSQSVAAALEATKASASVTSANSSEATSTSTAAVVQILAEQAAGEEGEGKATRDLTEVATTGGVEENADKMPELQVKPKQIYVKPEAAAPFNVPKEEFPKKKLVILRKLMRKNSTEKTTPTTSTKDKSKKPTSATATQVDEEELRELPEDQLTESVKEDGEEEDLEEAQLDGAAEMIPVVEPIIPERKKRTVKKKVIIKRQQRKLSITDSFFKEPDDEPALATESETLEKAIAYEKVDTDEEQDYEEIPKPAAPTKPCIKRREFQIGDLVLYAERYKKTQVRWKRGTVLERITSISYKLEIEGKEVPAHISYIKKYTPRKVNFGGKEYLEIDYEQIAEEEEKARNYSIWNMV